MFIYCELGVGQGIPGDAPVALELRPRIAGPELRRESARHWISFIGSSRMPSRVCATHDVQGDSFLRNYTSPGLGHFFFLVGAGTGAGVFVFSDGPAEEGGT